MRGGRRAEDLSESPSAERAFKLTLSVALMRAGDRVLMVLRPEMAREGVLRNPLRALSTIFLLSTPIRTPPKLSV